LERETIDKNDMGLPQEQNPSTKENDEQIQAKVQFVVVLERALGCVLEGKVEELKRAAAKSE